MSGEIKLDILQGEWLTGNGARVLVDGRNVSLNGLPLVAHKIELGDDGTVCGIGRLWQVPRWAENGAIEFSACHSRECMEFAPIVVWTRVDASKPWAEKMRLLGYAGTAADPLNRGVEGCIPGTLAQDMPSSKDADDMELLQKLISQWRESGLPCVRPCWVVPDCVNRENTGLGVELVHFIALSIREHGFRKRIGTEGHDIPVVVRDPTNSPLHAEALKAWKQKVDEEEGFPPVRVSTSDEMFTSLGNGHFFQALNLYDCGCLAINNKGKYVIGCDEDLQEALYVGVPSIVLKHVTPRPVRAKIAELLNAQREFAWNLNDNGTVDMTIKENTAYCKQFECMSKFLDAVQVNSLVRTHLGIHDSKRIQG